MKAFVNMLVGQPFLEAAYWLSSAYSLLAGDDLRKSLAMYFTPPSLTARLLDDLEAQGVQFDKGVVFDPACGGAAFLASVALRMKKRMLMQGRTPTEILQHVEENLFGTDLDSTLCALSNHFLKMALSAEICEARREPCFRIAKADSLSAVQDLFGKIDVVVCNPPYRKMVSTEVAIHRAAFGEVIESQPNMYGLFIALCVKLLRPGGVGALVTPTSFLSGQNFSKLRMYLTRETHIAKIGMVSERSGVFIDVEQETALTLLRRRIPNDAHGLEAQVAVVSPDGQYVDVGPCLLSNSGAAWPIPRTDADVPLLANAAASANRLRDYGYRVRVGTFVWNRDKRPVYISAAMSARCKTKSAVPLLWSSDIKSNGILHFDGMKKANTEPRFVSLGSTAHPSIVQRPSVLLQRVTSNDQPRRLVAAAVPSHIFDAYGGFVGENHTVIIEQIVETPELNPLQLAELLGSSVIDRCFRCISGATNVSAFELSHLPLPDPALLKEHMAQGKSIEDSVTSVFLNPESVGIKKEPLKTSKAIAAVGYAKDAIQLTHHQVSHDSSSGPSISMSAAQRACA